MLKVGDEIDDRKVVDIGKDFILFDDEKYLYMYDNFNEN